MSEVKSIFRNDPFAIVWEAFQKLYPGKKCECYLADIELSNESSAYGFVVFPEDGSTPKVYLKVCDKLSVMVEALADNLAQIAAGPEHNHDKVWANAFDAIHDEFRRIAKELGKELESDE